jgi:phosphoribosylanthranilate isomerase
MWVKICANTNLDDAQMALDLGADAIGFVFAPSARRVTPEQAGEITARLKGPGERVGVFHALEFDTLRDTVRIAGLTGVQLHGEGDPELAGRLKAEFGPALTIAQTLHWVVDHDVDGGNSAEQLLRKVAEIQAAGHVDRILVDSKVGSALGGTGRTFDWNAAQKLFAESGLPMIVAGGLGPGNVAEAIERLKPWGVDVASGVEREPGEKDPERLRQFIDRAQAAGESL